jgi:hypothetical protein
MGELAPPPHTFMRLHHRCLKSSDSHARFRECMATKRQLVGVTMTVQRVTMTHVIIAVVCRRQPNFLPRRKRVQMWAYSEIGCGAADSGLCGLQAFWSTDLRLQRRSSASTWTVNDILLNLSSYLRSHPIVRQMNNCQLTDVCCRVESVDIFWRRADAFVSDDVYGEKIFWRK